MNNRLYIHAIKALPIEWEDDATCIALWGEDSVVVANPNMKPMLFTEADGWRSTNLSEVLLQKGTP